MTTLTQPRPTALPFIAACAAMLLPAAVVAAEPVQLTLKDRRFVPAEVNVPAGERFRIVVSNQDAVPSEFESDDLRVEKVVVAGGKITVMAGPLKPGTYKFFDDYHPEAAGTITAQRQAKE